MCCGLVRIFTSARCTDVGRELPVPSCAVSVPIRLSSTNKLHGRGEARRISVRTLTQLQVQEAGHAARFLPGEERSPRQPQPSREGRTGTRRPLCLEHRSLRGRGLPSAAAGKGN